jgi:hypothetical protein
LAVLIPLRVLLNFRIAYSPPPLGDIKGLSPTINVKTSTVGPLGSVKAGDPGAPTINVKNVDGRPLGGARAEDTGVPTINAKKR